jgi:site-specific DNA recombinase
MEPRRRPLDIGTCPTHPLVNQNLVQDSERAPPVRQAFELYASGASSKAKILAQLTQLGLKGKSGRSVSQQTFDKILRSPLYAGWLTSTTWGITVRGQFQPIISDEVFDRVHERLGGGGVASRQTRSRENPDFPLRVFVRCEKCGKGLTGSFSTGRRGNRYPHYCCRVKGCREVKF